MAPPAAHLSLLGEQRTALHHLICGREPWLDICVSVLLQAHVEQWIDFTTTAVDAPLCSWVYPLMGYLPFDKKVSGALQKQDLLQILVGLNIPSPSYEDIFARAAR